MLTSKDLLPTERQNVLFPNEKHNHKLLKIVVSKICCCL